MQCDAFSGSVKEGTTDHMTVSPPQKKLILVSIKKSTVLDSKSVLKQDRLVQ